jgi:primosomal protein N' (replication factor Y)
MVYHKAQSKLMCHHCGKTLTPQPTQCPDCGGAIRYTGYGTQRIEEELAEKFPSASILRMDMDTTGKKDSHRQMLSDFAAHKYDILIGTQMVAKGLDFANVNLVGVIGVDALLFNQGYRAFEEVFSLVTQVVGRSGRAGQQGRAMIQTVDVNHPILNLAAAQDYSAFYEDEIQFRKLNLYPPFCSLCMIGFSARNEADAQAGAGRFNQILQQNARQAPDIPLRILGPSPYHIVMVNDRYRYKLTLKCRNDENFRRLLRKTAAEFLELPLASKISISFDFHSDDN